MQLLACLVGTIDSQCWGTRQLAVMIRQTRFVRWDPADAPRVGEIPDSSSGVRLVWRLECLAEEVRHHDWMRLAADAAG